MHAVIRRYSGASALVTEMKRKGTEVEAIIREVSGFVAYYAVGSGDALTTVTICDTEAGTTESTRRAAAWVKENLPGASMAPPQVAGGDVFLHFAR
jgi:hypothetical protein